MGNRAVITTKENFENNGIGIYLHWHGGRDSVEGFLEYCKRKGYRSPEQDSYGWACLITVIGNYFGTGLSVGVNTVDNLDCDNWDNGVYIIENWEIVDRKYFEGEEQYYISLEDMITKIESRQPKMEEEMEEEYE